MNCNIVRKILVAGSLLIFTSATAQDSNRWTSTEQREMFAAKVKGYEDCKQCHKFSVQSWEKTKHYKSLESLNLDQDGSASAIMQAMELTGSPVSQASCAQCHFTDKTSDSINQFTNKKFGPVSGVSCESCHGPASDWLELHNKKDLNEIKEKFSTLKTDKQKSEYLKNVHLKSVNDKVPGDFSAWRNKMTEKSGMIRPDMTYKLINNCYECHTIGNKDLINKTAELDNPHAAGSEFEIVSWLSGEVRHNFQGTDPDNPVNKKMSIEEKRYLYVSGKILFTEHALKALSLAEFPKNEDDEPSRFYDEMKSRVEIGLSEIIEINEILESAVPELKVLSENITPVTEKIGEDLLKKADLSTSNFSGKTLVGYLKIMNREFLKNSHNHAALSKLDETLNDLEPQGNSYK